MGRFVVRRAIQAVLVLIGISTILFFLLRLSGDPAALLCGLVPSRQRRRRGD